MANIFLSEGENQNHGGDDDTLFGRSGGSEVVVLLDGATGNNLDGNVERVEIPASAADAQFSITPQGQLQIEVNGTVLATFTAGLNQPVDVGFSAGSVTVEQTGATTFELQNPNDAEDVAIINENNSQVGNSVGLGTPDLDRGNISTNGEVLVDGTSPSEIPLTAGNIVVGDTGVGSLSASNATDFRLSADQEGGDQLGNLIVGRTSGANGIATLKGNGTTLVTEGQNNTIIVGLKGSGTLNIENGVFVNALEIQAGRYGTGTINISGEQTKVVASPDGGTFSKPFGWSAGFVEAGDKNGSDGTLRVTNGALLEIREGQQNNSDTSGPTLNVGSEPQSQGDLIVDDADIQIQQDSFLVKVQPQFNIGQGGTGTANIRNDGVVQIQGPDSEVTVGSVHSDVAGTGTLNVQTGGRVESLRVTIADAPGSSGTVNVSGANSLLQASGTADESSIDFGQGGIVTVGGNGQGALNIDNGGSVRISTQEGDFPGIQVGRNDGSDGTLVVSGAGSTLSVDGPGTDPSLNSGFAYVGRNGGSGGSMRVEAGGEVSNQDNGIMVVGANAGSTGTVTVADQGSVVDAGSKLLIGITPQSTNPFDPGALDFSTGGSGTVTVESGGTLRAGAAENDGIDDVFIGSSGTLQIQSGGTLVGDVRNEGGTFSPGNSPGIASIEGDVDHTGSIKFEIDGTSSGEFDQIDVTGEARLEGEFVLDFGDGFVPDQDDEFEVVNAREGVNVADLDVSVSGMSESRDASLEISATGITAHIEDDVSGG